MDFSKQERNKKEKKEKKQESITKALKIVLILMNPLQSPWCVSTKDQFIKKIVADWLINFSKAITSNSYKSMFSLEEY